MSIAKAERIAKKTGLEPRQIKQWFTIERFKRGLRSSNGPYGKKKSLQHYGKEKICTENFDKMNFNHIMNPQF